ncbi:hypothetical protein [Blastochloris tepida]|uniref:Uncharacterized protein n=1 Tax=Blastochloris tepida TaxID=2233851 RepID=A0A348FZB3_9HYPH|nr:hypothetical protein [Blastochloris tepida]BBF92646.1 hypothetical protein BLTE_13310 [Blastochloris tepida]
MQRAYAEEQRKAVEEQTDAIEAETKRQQELTDAEKLAQTRQFLIASTNSRLRRFGVSLPAPSAQ